MFYLPEIDFLVRHDEPSIAKFLSRSQHGYIMLMADDSNVMTSNVMYIGYHGDSDQGYLGTYIDNQYLQKIFAFNLHSITNYTNLIVSNNVQAAHGGNIQRWNEAYLSEAASIYFNNLEASIQHTSNISFLKSNNTSLALNANSLKLINTSGHYSLLSTDNTCTLNSYDPQHNLMSSIQLPTLSTSTFTIGCNLYMTRDAVAQFIFPESSYFLDETSNEQIIRYLNYSNEFTNMLSHIDTTSSNITDNIASFVNAFSIDTLSYQNTLVYNCNLVYDLLLNTSNDLSSKINQIVSNTHNMITNTSNQLFNQLYEQTSNECKTSIMTFYNNAVNSFITTSNEIIASMILDTSNNNKYLFYEFKQADMKADSSGNNRSLITVYNAEYNYDYEKEFDTIFINSKSFAALPVANFYNFKYLSIHSWIKPTNLELYDHIFYFNIFENSIRYPKQALNAPSITTAAGVVIKTAESSFHSSFRSWRLYDDLRWGVGTDPNAPGYVSSENSYDMQSGFAKNTNQYFRNDSSYHGEWFMIDLGEYIFLEKYKFYLNNSFILRCPNTFRLYASDNADAWNNPKHNSWENIDDRTNITDYKIYVVNEFTIPQMYQKKSYRFFAVIVNKIQTNNDGFMNLTQVEFNGNKDSSILIQNIHNALVFSINSTILYTYHYLNTEWFYFTWNIYNDGKSGYVKINNGEKNYFDILPFTKPTITNYICRLGNLYNAGNFNLASFSISDYKLPKTVLEDVFDVIHIPIYDYIGSTKTKLYADIVSTSNELFPQIRQMDIGIKTWLGQYTMDMSNMIMQNLGISSNQLVGFHDTIYNYSITSNYAKNRVYDNIQNRLSTISELQNTTIDNLSMDNIKIGSSNQIIRDRVYSKNLQTKNLKTMGNVVPHRNMQYDLGSSARRWSDLYVSSNSIYLGENKIHFENTYNGLLCNPGEIFMSKINLFDSYSFSYTQLQIEKNELTLKSYNILGQINFNVFRIKSLDNIIEGTSNIYYKRSYAENIIRSSNIFNYDYITNSQDLLNQYIHDYNADMIKDGLFKDHIYDKNFAIKGQLIVSQDLQVNGQYINIHPFAYEIENAEITADNTSAFKIVQTGSDAIINLGNVLKINNEGKCGINMEADEKIHINGSMQFSHDINDISSNTFSYLSGIRANLHQSLLDCDRDLLSYIAASCNHAVQHTVGEESWIYEMNYQLDQDSYGYFATTCNYHHDFVKTMNSNIDAFEDDAFSYINSSSNDIKNHLEGTSNVLGSYMTNSDRHTSNYFGDVSQDLFNYYNVTSNNLENHLDYVIKKVIGWDSKEGGNTFNDFFNIGIGTLMPEERLDIHDSIRFSNGTFNSTNANEIDSMTGLRRSIQQQIDDLHSSTSNYIKYLDVGFSETSNNLETFVTLSDVNMSNHVNYCINDLGNYLLHNSNHIDDVIKRLDERKLWYTLNDDINNGRISYGQTVVIGRDHPENSNLNKLEIFGSNLDIINADVTRVLFRPIPNIHPSIIENSLTRTNYERIYGNTYYYVYTNSGSITFHHDTICDVFLIGGGGSGGGTIGGGGGSGACVISIGYTFVAGTYDIVVGQGGLGVQLENFGNNGGYSRIGNIFVAKGGGGGGKFDKSGKAGGSSGGSGADYAGATDNVVFTNVVNGNIVSGPIITSNYAILGNIGGTSVESTGDRNELNAGGGGGIGSHGISGTLAAVGTGGDGAYEVVLQNGVTYKFKDHFSPSTSFGVAHDNKYYIGGGGGGGGYQDSIVLINGGYGGGGSGIDAKGPTGANGMPNTGSGGGAISYNDAQSGVGILSGSGGSGLVIIRYTLSLGKEPVPQKVGIHRWSDANNKNIIYDGSIGVHKDHPQTKLHVGDGGSSNQGLYRYFSASSNNLSGASVNSIVDDICTIFDSSMLVSGKISAASDYRIKRNILDIDDDSALETIMKIQPKIYQYIDGITRGTSNVYGFIAQNVRDVLPHAVKLQEDVIPNIYKYAEVDIDENRIHISVDDLAIGDVIYIIDKNNTGNEYKVIAKTSDTITVDGMIMNDEVFVYGKKIQDFHALDKSYVYTMNVCATQTLADKIKGLKTRVNSLM
jgi:hypothetical protein